MAAHESSIKVFSEDYGSMLVQKCVSADKRLAINLEWAQMFLESRALLLWLTSTRANLWPFNTSSIPYAIGSNNMQVCILQRRLIFDRFSIPNRYQWYDCMETSLRVTDWASPSGAPNLVRRAKSLFETWALHRPRRLVKVLYSSRCRVCRLYHVQALQLAPAKTNQSSRSSYPV